MDTNALLQQIRNLEQLILQQGNKDDKMEATENNIVSITTKVEDPDSPSRNKEYKRRLRKLRVNYRKELRDLKKEFGVAFRHRANFTKGKKG